MAPPDPFDAALIQLHPIRGELVTQVRRADELLDTRRSPGPSR